MNLPEGVTATNVKPSKPGYATADLTIDVHLFLKAFQEGMRTIGEALTTSMRSFNRLIRYAVNDEVRVSGLEARYYVRGAMGCQSPQELDALVLALLSDPRRTAPADEAFMMTLLTNESRARLAVSAIRGWAETHPGGPCGPLSWHRYLAGTKIEMTR